MSGRTWVLHPVAWTFAIGHAAQPASAPIVAPTRQTKPEHDRLRASVNWELRRPNEELRRRRRVGVADGCGRRPGRTPLGRVLPSIPCSDRDQSISAATRSRVCVTAYVLGDLCGDSEPATEAAACGAVSSASRNPPAQLTDRPPRHRAGTNSDNTSTDRRILSPRNEDRPQHRPRPRPRPGRSPSFRASQTTAVHQPY